jgi:cyclohexanecarboxylate-CoA ligase
MTSQHGLAELRSLRSRPRNTVTPSDRQRAYVEAGLWNADTLSSRVGEHARERGDRTAVIDLGGARQRTYRELDRDVNRLAYHLGELGVLPGDVVSAQLANWYETVVVAVAIMRAGAILNPMLSNYRRLEVRHMLNVGGVRVFFSPRIYRRFDHAGLGASLRDGDGPLEHHIVIEDPELNPDAFSLSLADFPERPSGVRADSAAVSELIFTSGTEAAPKAILHTEQNANFAARSVWSSLGMGDEDVVWMPSPIGHSTGFNYGVRIALYHGLPLVLQDQWSAETAIALIERFRCSYTVVATTFVADIVELGTRRSADLSSMRLFGSGGSPIPSETVTAARDLGMNVLRLYGSTEVLMATTNRTDSTARQLVETDGAPMDHIEIEIRDENGPAAVGEPGEILVRGPQTSVGFYDDPERSAATFTSDGWVRTGDLGVLDEDGYLTIVGRKKEIIIRGGLNIAPREIEDLVLRHPAVLEVAVVGLPHQRLGEMTCACVVLREGAALDLDGLVAHLRSLNIATYKLPQRLEVVEALPRTPSGKVQKFRILERFTKESK